LSVVADDHRGHPGWTKATVVELLIVAGETPEKAEELWGLGSRGILAHIDKHPQRTYSEFIVKQATERIAYPTAASRHLFP
jgi:hypothetical protein